MKEYIIKYRKKATNLNVDDFGYFNLGLFSAGFKRHWTIYLTL